MSTAPAVAPHRAAFVAALARSPPEDMDFFIIIMEDYRGHGLHSFSGSHGPACPGTGY